MRKYVVDTNLYLEATGDDNVADELKRFHAGFLPYIHLHSVVAHELLAGDAVDRLVHHVVDAKWYAAIRSA